MRMLMNVIFPSEPFNSFVREGSAGEKIKKILEKIKPETVYFTEMHGQRGAILVVKVKDASGIPALSEPWFLTFEAEVELRLAMSPEELEKADLGSIGNEWA